MNKKYGFLWFLIGLGYKLQLVASLSISEVIVSVGALLVFFKSYRQMRRNGVWPFFVLSILLVIGCIVASVANGTPYWSAVRGLMTTCLISTSIVFSHWLLSRDPAGFKWFFLGLPISGIISTYIFQASVEVSAYGASAENIMEGQIYWISRLEPIVFAASRGWYLHVPYMVNVCAPLFMALFAVLTNVSGRSAALGAIGFMAFVLIGGNTKRSMGRLSRHFGMLCLIGIAIVGGSYLMYKTAARNGWLGEESRIKYEVQSAGGTTGIVGLLIGGRAESFVGLLACRDKPIIGWGPWPKDEGGYTEEFMQKYGTRESFEWLIKQREWYMKFGVVDRLLPWHSYIVQFWAWFGIWGLVFWVYVIYVFLRYIRQDIATVPQWYGWLACSLPAVFWSIFFNPFAERVSLPLMVVACLMARAARLGRWTLPVEMLDEMVRIESKRR